MCDLGKVAIAASFTRPKVQAVLLGFDGVIGKVIGAKAQDNYLSNFKLEVFSGQEHLVAGNKGQHPLVIIGKLLLRIYPILFHHFP
jgi:hypothetical protein